MVNASKRQALRADFLACVYRPLTILVYEPQTSDIADWAERLIHFENVGLRYGMGPEILRDLTFDVPKGSFQFLTGPSGAGKTTLLRLLFMSLQPTRGLIKSFGRDITRIPRAELPMLRRRVGIVFQDFRLLEHLTTYENVALPLRVRGKEEQSYKQDVIELLKWVGLGERINVLPPVLSGGEKQRVAIARALIDRPEILLADEPTGNVDPPMARRLLSLFLELNRLGTAVIIATHDLALMDQVDARRMILTDGRLDIYE
jgi:cell division transport system ATP-binding protein